MGGFVSDVVDTVSPYAGLIGGAAGGPMGAVAGSMLGGALGGAGNTPQSQYNFGNMVQGGLGIAGSMQQNAVSRAAAEAAQRQALAGGQTAANMAAFRPVGTTTRFGTSAYSIDPATGGLKADYSLSPLAQGYQNQLAGMTNQGLMQGQQLQGLANQYLGESPEAVRQRYVQQQTALTAPGNEQALAGIRNNLFQTGRQGLATGATTAGNMAATNPEMAAYYNSLANTERRLAADAETQYQNQVNFGTGLLGSATTPFNNVFSSQKAVETAAQQPLGLSTDFANTVATRGAAQGANYAAAMNPSLTNSFNAANYNPAATAFQGAASNPLVGYGLLKAFS
jgi:hypothetical protein